MPRASQREAIAAEVERYLAQAELASAEDHPLNVRAVAAKLGISPTTLYKHHFDQAITAARERQRQQIRARGSAKKRKPDSEVIQQLRSELEQERERNQGLVTKIVLMEANAAENGWDPDELYRPIPKPPRSIPHIRRGRKRSR